MFLRDFFCQPKILKKSISRLIFSIFNLRLKKSTAIDFVQSWSVWGPLDSEVVNTAATSLLHAELPANYWPYALICVTHDLNSEDAEGYGHPAWKHMTGEFGRIVEGAGDTIWRQRVCLKPTDGETYGENLIFTRIPGVPGRHGQESVARGI